MKLLDVKAVLDRETGMQENDPEREILKELEDGGTHYAILSHRWGAEVSYKEMTGLMKLEEQKRDEVRQRAGYRKIIESCKQAMKDEYKWLWVDTCCIDKRSSAELSEAINSMYRWYQNAQVCYVYLNDVDQSTFPAQQDKSKFDKSNGWPEWFVRGWTLQELIAPKRVEFFNKDWVHIGNKQRFAPTLERTTGIPSKVLTSGLAGKRLSVAQIMSWAAERKTTRVEDRAYSLMGLFGVNMPMLYGEGKRAFQRLQLEIIRGFTDQSIFAWNPQMPRTGSVLAEDPSDFRGCGGIEKVEPDKFVHRLRQEYIKYGYSNKSSRRDIDSLAASCDEVEFQQFTVSNAGIQVLLLVVPSYDSPSYFRAILACTQGEGLVAIDLVSFGRSFSRTSINSLLPATYPNFKTLHLIHHQDTNETRREFVLDDLYASYHGFTRRGTYPRQFTRNNVTLSSLAEDLVVIVYANKDARSCFAVGLGYYFGHGWVHVENDRYSPTQEENWMDFGTRAYHRMWEARAKHAQNMLKCQALYSGGYGNRFVKHAHLPRSIWAVRVVWGRWEEGDLKVMVDVVECPGCCDGPYRTTITSTDQNGLTMPGLMNIVSRSYSLELDEKLAWADECCSQRIALGDYGDYTQGNLVRAGNIFEDMRAAGVDLDDASTYGPAVSRVSSRGFGIRLDWIENQDDRAVAYHTWGTHLALHQPKAISLPANEHFSLLLKALSIRLAGKNLVTTLIQCSDFYVISRGGNGRDPGRDSTPDNGNHSTEAGILTPLCTIASPQVWRREVLRTQTKRRLRIIREQFYALVDMHQRRFEPSQKSTKKNIAIKFFEDLFALEYLQNYIGYITFFARFPSIMETCPVGDVPSVGAAEEDGSTSGRQLAVAETDTRLEAVLPLLHKRCQTLCESDDAQRRCADERQRVEDEIKCISQTLGADLLKHIRIAFYNAYREHESPSDATHRVSPVKYDRQLDIPSMVQDIKELQVTLNATKDRDELRALEEDVTGKILWLFWCGICAEVDELLPTVVEFIRREANMKGLQEICWLYHLPDPSDDQALLQRVMYDAGAKTSKHLLWLAARAAEQAKWSGTNRGTPTVDNQRTSPSTSCQHPPNR